MPERPSPTFAASSVSSDATNASVAAVILFVTVHFGETAVRGMVTVVVNGRLQVVSLRIDPEVLKSSDLDMLQDLIVAAVNQGVRNAQALVAEEMKKVTGGLKIPGLTG